MKETENTNPEIIARRKYFKEWRDKNKDKIKEYNKKFWLKKSKDQNN